ncbi:hypothetical protein SNE40_001391 [Patella caerulea]|uniref:PKD/REJ-like domain-containing protein n=1 Tax=Patella caerulea TaxID=87958 RepID=A0AAN8KIJ7_PATCE
MINGDPKTISHKFAKAGYVIPQIKCTSDRRVEVLDLSDSLYIENEIRNLEAVVDSEYGMLDDVVQIIKMGQVDCLPVINVTCFNEHADDLNLRPTEFGNIIETSNTSTTLRYPYPDKYALITNCSNYLSYQIINMTYIVYSQCFDTLELFDRDYRDPLNPFTHIGTMISGRARVSGECRNMTNLIYVWTIQKSEGLSISYLQKKLFSTGHYRLELLMYFPFSPNDFIADFIYVQLRPPPLTAKIKGGAEIEICREMMLRLDVKSLSYDEEIGEGVTDPELSFEWSCYLFTDHLIS